MNTILLRFSFNVHFACYHETVYSFYRRDRKIINSLEVNSSSAEGLQSEGTSLSIQKCCRTAYPVTKSFKVRSTSPTRNRI